MGLIFYYSLFLFCFIFRQLAFNIRLNLIQNFQSIKKNRNSIMSSNFQNNDSPFSANGRFGRLSYLGWNMLMFIIVISFFFVVGIIASFIAPNLFSSTAYGSISIPFMLIMAVVYITLIYISFIFIIRRLHDCNQRWIRKFEQHL